MPIGLVVPCDDGVPAIARVFETLEDYQAGVHGLIEPIEIEALGITVYLNEEGRFQGLPFNPRITFLQWFHVPQSRSRTMLVGDAVVIGSPNSKGEHEDVPNEVSRLFSPETRFIVEVRVGGGAWLRQSSPSSYFEAAVWAMLLEEKSAIPIQVKVKSV